MTDVKYPIDQINSEIGKLLAESNLEELTPKIVRRKLEERLKYQEFSLDEEEPRTLIKGILDEFVARVQQEQEKQEEEGNNEASGSEGDFESDEGSTKPSKKSKKRKLTSEGSGNEEDNSESDDDSKSEKSQRSKSNSTASKSSKDPSAKMSLKIKNLKNYVLKCGVRKVWSKELRGMSDRQQVKHLQNLLKSLGVEGRPTLEKCKKVSILRELEGADIPTESESESENGDYNNEGEMSDMNDNDDSDTRSKSSKKGGKKIIESDDDEGNGKNGKVDEKSEDNNSEIAVKSAKSGTEDDEEDPSNTKPKSKPVNKKPKVELTPTQEKISKLKSFVFKCGVRKMWSKELADLDEREQISKLSSILRELGVEGQPTNDKCARVKEMRELEAEKNSVDVNNIIESDSDDDNSSAPRTRSSRSATQNKVKSIEKEVEKLEEVKPQKRNDFFSFLNDSDIDD